MDVVLQVDEGEKALAGRTHCVVAASSSLCARVNESDEGQCARWAGTNIPPVVPLTRTFVIATVNVKRTLISRHNCPSPAYTSTDYRAQAQTVEHCVVSSSMAPASGSFDAICSTILQPRKDNSPFV